MPSNSYLTAVMLLSVASLAGCATDRVKPEVLNVSALPTFQVADAVPSRDTSQTVDLLYVTDRAAETASDGSQTYGSERAMFLSFGKVSTAASLNSLASKRQLRIGAISEIGRFPATPYGIVATAKGLRRTPMAVAAHRRATAALQAEVARRLATAGRKEVVVFIHGYNNSFDDAVRATGETCESLESEFVCIVLTWPAGGSGGLFFGYNIDRESSEFAVADLKKAIRIIAESSGVQRLHLLAHSRGTDVLAGVMQQLSIEAYVSRSSLWQRFKIANVVYFAPDIDLDVASSKLFAWISDPDLAFGGRSSPAAFPAQGPLHLTIYSSRGDKALGVSKLLSGSALRLGQLAVDRLPEDRLEEAKQWEEAKMGRLVDFIEVSGLGGIVGHRYFREPAVRADLSALIRDRVAASDPRRRLVEVKRPFWQLPNAYQTISSE